MIRSIGLLLLAALPLMDPRLASAEDDRPVRRVADAELQETINRSIKRGIEYLKKVQRRDGSWRYCKKSSQAEGTVAPAGTGGLTALALYALAASDVPAKDDAVRRGVKWVLGKPDSFKAGSPYATYSASFLVLALTRVSATQYREHIKKVAQLLEKGRLPGSGWSYDLLSGVARKKQVKRMRKLGGRPSRGDLSNTQFAVLALWAAETLGGYKVRRSTWTSVRKKLSGLQLPSGAWRYGLKPAGDARASMIAAGLVSHILADAGAAGGSEHLPKARASAVAKRGLSALRALKAFKSFKDCYHAYSIERVGTVLALPSRDWYATGARGLIKSQRPDGGWRKGERGDFQQTYETALALLFLSRATAIVTPK